MCGNIIENNNSPCLYIGGNNNKTIIHVQFQRFTFGAVDGIGGVSYSILESKYK